MEHNLSTSWQMPKDEAKRIDEAFKTRDEILKKMNGGVNPKTYDEVMKIMKK